MGGRVEERMVFEADNMCIIQGKEEFVTKMLLSDCKMLLADVKCSLIIVFFIDIQVVNMIY